jgi:hypothetical protein
MTDEYSLVIKDKETLDLLSAYDEAKRQEMALKALRVGLVALKNIETVGNVDYVEKEFLKLSETFNKKLEEADTLIKDKLAKNFDPKSGMMSQVLNRYLGEGGELADLFDEENNSSATAKIKKILGEYFDDEASTVVRLLDPTNPKSPLNSFREDILNRLVEIEKEIRGKEMAKAEAQKGTQKGLVYEELVFCELEKIARIFGDTCLPVGKEVGLIQDSLRGDIAITLNSASTGGATLKIIFEAKDKSMYINDLLDELEEAKRNRGAGVAVAVVSGKDTLKDVKESIGAFRDYQNNRSICVLDKEVVDPTALEVAYKLGRTKLLLGLQVKEMKSEAIDIVAINILIEDILKKLKEFALIKSTLTKATGTIDEAQDQIETMKNELTVKLEELSEKAKPPKK